MEVSIMDFSKFKSLTTEEQIAILKDYRSIYKNKELIEGWGISSNEFYKMLNSLGLKTTSREYTAKSRGVVISQTTEDEESEEADDIDKDFEFVFALSGKYEADKLARKLTKLVTLLECDPTDFHVDIHVIKESEKK